MSKRLFIVANRLPFNIAETEEGLQIMPSSGGLVTAVNSFLQNGSNNFTETYWAGVPGCNAAVWHKVENRVPASNYTYLPVLAPKKQYEHYYNGFSNSVLWPLFHYFPSFAEYDVEAYDDYTKVNEQFAQVLIKHLHPGDTVWIHDYHLLPLAELLRSALPQLTIGFFLHIPFPSFEIFRMLPRKWQQQLLSGILGADLVGFHTIDYAAHFLQCVQMVLGLENERNIIRHDNRLIKVDVFPISIDYETFNKAYQTPEVNALRQSLLQKMSGKQIVFSVDRLDYTKGVRNRLKAYEYFLMKNPEYHNKVVFIIVVVPSRDTIPKYAERKRIIDQLISQINSRVGNIHWQPIIYQYNYLSFNDMLCLYTAANLALITPLRDGMNLVAKEFVASRQDQQGVLVISEMAGAARELTDALTINPNDVMEIAEKIKEGLEMPQEEQKERMANMQRRVASYNVQAWADDFMSSMESIKHRQKSFQETFLDAYAKRSIFDAYRGATKRLLLLDYDGTLVPFARNPEQAVPGGQLLNLLADLSGNAENDVYIISGRNSSFLQKHLGHLPVNLISEHGAKFKLKNDEWRNELPLNNEWKEQVHAIMEMYVRRCPNSFIEEKEFSFVWHYRNANSSQGKLRALELMYELNEYVRNSQLQVLMGNKIVEVRTSGIDKGSAIKKVLARKSYDFVFAAGDDRTDEDMFKFLLDRKNCFTIKVGSQASYARYNLHTPQMVISMLQALSNLRIAGVLYQ